MSILEQLQVLGLACLVMGLIILETSFYLYHADLQFEKKIQETPTDPQYMGPIKLPPYYYVQPVLTAIGAGSNTYQYFLMSYKQIKNRICYRK